MKNWPENCWYVAAHAHEVTDQLFARTILGQALIFWRIADGRIAALADRCPHRLVPLSTGKTVDGVVECGYHGIQDTIPSNACVKTFPVAERHALIWVWLGAAELADESLIPDIHWLDAPGWTSVTGSLHFKCDYRLINDNLLDLCAYTAKCRISNRRPSSRWHRVMTDASTAGRSPSSWRRAST